MIATLFTAARLPTIVAPAPMLMLPDVITSPPNKDIFEVESVRPIVPLT
jgi:hypothetical protein